MTKIYLDLDGVFADFDKAVAGINKEPIAEFWKKVQDIPNFFYNLDTIPGSEVFFHAIFGYQDTLGIPVEMLTALPRPTKHLVTAKVDKETWVAEKLSPKIKTNCSDGWHRKVHWVGYDHILIDDTKRNILHWAEHGGIGIHHTGDWNATMRELNISIATANQRK